MDQEDKFPEWYYKTEEKQQKCWLPSPRLKILRRMATGSDVL